jgi:hypothetical protein
LHDGAPESGGCAGDDHDLARAGAAARDRAPPIDRTTAVLAAPFAVRRHRQLLINIS